MVLLSVNTFTIKACITLLCLDVLKAVLTVQIMCNSAQTINPLPSIILWFLHTKHFIEIYCLQSPLKLQIIINSPKDHSTSRLLDG